VNLWRTRVVARVERKRGIAMLIDSQSENANIGFLKIRSGETILGLLTKTGFEKGDKGKALSQDKTLG